MHKNENRPGYKNSKVGWIPAEWKDSRLKDCSVKIGSGITPKGGSETYLSVGIPMIRSQNVLDGTFSSAGLIYISDEQHEIMKGSALEPNDVLFNITGASIGRCCLFPEHFGEANVNQHVCIVRLKNTCHPKLFVNILNSHIIKRQLHENQAGGGREGLNFQNLGGFRIPTPPLPEQKAIAGVLECWDRGVRNLELKIEKKRLIKNGLMQRLLSGKQRLKCFSEAWKNVRLEEICSMKSGETITSKSIHDNAAFPCFGGNGLRGFTDSFTHDGVFVLIGRQGALCGNVHLVTGKFFASEHAVVATAFDKTSPSWLSAILKFKNLNRHSESSAQPGLSVSKVLKMRIPYPPLPEQQAIAGVLSAADGEIEALEKKLTLWKEQKKYLLNNLVTGTIRLPQFCLNA